jgi:tRNA (cmo5U34)-methyltransferase
MTQERFDKAAATWDEKPLRLQLATAIAAAMKGAVQPNRQMSALEIGCGTGLVTTGLAPLLQSILAIDTSDGMLTVLNEKISTLGLANITTKRFDLIADFTKLAGTPFDLIYSSMVFHHIKHIDAVLGNCRELLAPGGLLCVADLDEEDGSFHDDMQGVEHKGFNQKRLAALATECGFTGIRFSTAHVIAKEVEGVKRQYPVFLMIAGRGA